MTPLQSDSSVLKEIELYVASQTGFMLSGKRLDVLQRSVEELQRATKCNLFGYLQRLKTDKSTLDTLIEKLTVNETYFFRYAYQFQLLRDEIIPEVRSRLGMQRPDKQVP